MILAKMSNHGVNTIPSTNGIFMLSEVIPPASFSTANVEKTFHACTRQTIYYKSSVTVDEITLKFYFCEHQETHNSTSTTLSQ